MKAYSHRNGPDWTWIIIAVIVIAWLLLAKEYINY